MRIGVSKDNRLWLSSNQFQCSQLSKIVHCLFSWFEKQRDQGNKVTRNMTTTVSPGIKPHEYRSAFQRIQMLYFILKAQMSRKIIRQNVSK